MYTGVSGLQANGLAVSIIGDNIANVNTIGFKASRGNFDSVLQQTILGRAGSTSQLGGGVVLSDVQHLFTQGSLMNTGQSTDLAISGAGFFVVNGTYNGVEGNFFTRAGQFVVDNDGYLVNTGGLRVQGYSVDATGQLLGTVGDLNISSQNVPPAATTLVEVTANLDADDPIQAVAWDPTDPAGTSNYSTTITVYDSLGNSRAVEVYFRKVAANAWEWHAMVDGGELAGGTPGVTTEIADGAMTFTVNGELDTEVINNNTVDFLGAAPGQVIDFDFGDSITTDGGNGLTGTTGFAGANSINFQRQDGFATGTLQNISVTPDGLIMGSFSNGEVRQVGQLALATFQSTAGLDRTGGNLWIQTRDSGEPLIGAANTGSRGAIYSYSLEQSNVDMAEQFVHLIGAQRGFQANSKIITTSDQMLAETINMKH
jgi:flagellar hook protein FlgE